MTTWKGLFVVVILLPMLGAMLRPSLRALGSGEKHADAVPANVLSAHDDVKAAAAFSAILPVLRHPRCMNCHSTGDFPRQGDDGHRHTMNVRRGVNGEGISGLQCSTCHQDHNLAGEHVPPGAPGWHLPSAAMPMIWEGLGGRQLCELFKDPARNGRRSLEEIVRHMNTPLVLWGWHPGDGRMPITVPENEFLANIKTWAANGAACPTSE